MVKVYYLNADTFVYEYKDRDLLKIEKTSYKLLYKSDMVFYFEDECIVFLKNRYGPPGNYPVELDYQKAVENSAIEYDDRFYSKK